MNTIYPVRAILTNNTEDGERAWGIFDPSGYWACHAPSERIFIPTNERELAQNIVKAINAAYYSGKADAREAVRLALGMEE